MCHYSFRGYTPSLVRTYTKTCKHKRSALYSMLLQYYFVSFFFNCCLQWFSATWRQLKSTQIFSFFFGFPLFKSCAHCILVFWYPLLWLCWGDKGWCKNTANDWPRRTVTLMASSLWDQPDKPVNLDISYFTHWSLNSSCRCGTHITRITNSILSVSYTGPVYIKLKTPSMQFHVLSLLQPVLPTLSAISAMENKLPGTKTD